NDDGPTRRFLTSVVSHDEYQWSSGMNDDQIDSIQQQDQEEEEDMDPMDIYIFVSAFLFSLAMAPLLAILAMGYMLKNAIGLVKFSLILPIALNAVAAVLILVAGVLDDDGNATNTSAADDNDDDEGSAGGAVVPLFFAIFLTLYARAVWHRIPFAAANLKAAITCVRSNLGMAFLGLAKIPIFLSWLFLWSYTYICVLGSPMMQPSESGSSGSTSTSSAGSDEDGPTSGQVFGGFVLFALIFCFIWTWNVLKNVIHCSLAGTVGTWWFLPQEASTCCSRGLTHSLSRSLTYSFGSICMGSLLVAIIEFLKGCIRRLTRNRYVGLLLFCIAECLLAWIERLAQYFNKWAYVYVGVYGYGYIEAGKNVFALFRNRGWTAIISDLLVSRMLGMLSLCIGLINALVAALFSMGASSTTIIASSFTAFFSGLILSGLVFSVLNSANEAIIVLFCEAPEEFRNNHSELARELDDTWTQAWPEVFAAGPVVTAEPV
ncbi:MAG: hypothetical protein SGILL_002148, partial [Bacillariaceae sp.]